MRWLSPPKINNRHQGCAPTDSVVWGIGVWKRGVWGGEVVRVEPLGLSCFAPEI